LRNRFKAEIRSNAHPKTLWHPQKNRMVNTTLTSWRLVFPVNPGSGRVPDLAETKK
jgi:hypothetical protein